MKEPISGGMKVAVLILMTTFFYLFSVTFLPMTENGVEQAKTIVPFLLGNAIGVLLGYYWGNSSKGKTSLEGEVGNENK